MDTAAVVTAISDISADVVVIGGAILLVLAVVAGVTYLRRVVR